MTAVLLVEDESAVAEPLATAMRREGYTTDVCATGSEAWAAARAHRYELVVLDLGLPDMDGIALCRRLREADPDVPVLLLTARAEEIDIVVGLDAGADDYVTKPFRLAELFARMRALLRRGGADTGIVIGKVSIEPAARRVEVGGAALKLSTKEFDLLLLLARQLGSVVPRDRIVAEVWGSPGIDSSRTVDTHVSSLRRKLLSCEPGLRLEAVRGVGFRLTLS